MQKELLQKYVNAVLAAPKSLCLTATENPAEFWERHVLDALKIISLLPAAMHESPRQVLDLGSGNGIPGIPIAIAIPKWNVFLLDSNNKKCGFLDMFCKFNAIKNVHVLPGRAEEFGRQKNFRESFDLVFARALGKLPTALELAAPFLRPEGLLVIPHGSSYAKELDRSANAIKELRIVYKEAIPYKINPTLGFTALLFAKISETPERYPRKTGLPAKRPL